MTHGTTMSTVGYGAFATPSGRRAKTQRLRRFARALRRIDSDERYSPVLCIAMILVVGLIVKLTPVMHVYFAQN